MKDAPESQAFVVATTNSQLNQVFMLTNAPLFVLGEIVSTPAALEVIQVANISPLSLLRRHVTGDWGDLNKHDKQLNDFAVRDGDSRIFSSYNIGHGQRLWIITEADRSSTCLLKPEDY